MPDDRSHESLWVTAVQAHVMLGNVTAAYGAINQMLTREVSTQESKALLEVAEEHLLLVADELGRWVRGVEDD